MGKNLSKLPKIDRPYEKFDIFGAENLSNSELLAIIIKTGTKNLNCVEVAQNILNKNVINKVSNMSDLEYLSSMSIPELVGFEGIGKIKAIQIKSVIELAKRISQIYSNKEKLSVSSPANAYDVVKDYYIGKKQEIIKTIILNKANKVLSVITNSIGNVDNTSTTLKDIFSEPIKQLASSIILVHNHPSGNLVPSSQDIRFTNYIKENGEVFGVKLIDHILVGNSLGEYISFKEKGFM